MFSKFSWTICVRYVSLLSRIISSTIQGHGPGVGGGEVEPSSQKPSPLSPQMKWHFIQGSMESHHFESRSAPGQWASLFAPSFWKVWLCPCYNLLKVKQVSEVKNKCDQLIVTWCKDSWCDPWQNRNPEWSEGTTGPYRSFGIKLL